jgi:DNA-binding transcriptional ArsR family regulator
MNPLIAQKAQEQAEFCSTFGNSHRILIVWALGDEELTVSEISEQIGASMQNTSQHLRLMKNKGVLLSRREGREIYYRIADTKFSKICQIISDTS